jgi:hypothetical protein
MHSCQNCTGNSLSSTRTIDEPSRRALVCAFWSWIEQSQPILGCSECKERFTLSLPTMSENFLIFYLQLLGSTKIEISKPKIWRENLQQ